VNHQPLKRIWSVRDAHRKAGRGYIVSLACGHTVRTNPKPHPVPCVGAEMACHDCARENARQEERIHAFRDRYALPHPAH
jgi:hypothetical protein